MSPNLYVATSMLIYVALVLSVKLLISTKHVLELHTFYRISSIENKFTNKLNFLIARKISEHEKWLELTFLKEAMIPWNRYLIDLFNRLEGSGKNNVFGNW